MKKVSADIIILHLCTKNYDHMMYGSWDMMSNGQMDRWIDRLVGEKMVGIKIWMGRGESTGEIFPGGRGMSKFSAGGGGGGEGHPPQ